MLKNEYQYSIENLKEIPEEQDQKKQQQVVIVNILKLDNELIGTVKLQFSEDSVSRIFASNLVVLEIISEDYREEIAKNTDFLNFGSSLEHFNRTWQLVKKRLPTHNGPRLEINFWGIVTEIPLITTEEPGESNDKLSDLIWDVVLLLRWSLSKEDHEELRNRTEIISVLTKYILEGRINGEDINTIRNVAGKLRGADDSVSRKLSIAAISIFGLIIGVVAALVILNIPLAVPPALIIALAAIFFVASVISAGVSATRKKPDFPSRAVLYLADKMEKMLPPPENFVSSFSSDLSSVNLKREGTQLKTQSDRVFHKVKFELSSSEHVIPSENAFNKLCLTTLNPALKKITGKDSINRGIYQPLRDGLWKQYHQGISLVNLKTQIDRVLKKQTLEEK